MILEPNVIKISENDEPVNIYYVRDEFGQTWQTVGDTPEEALDNIRYGEDILTFKLYTVERLGESLPKYDFKNLIIDTLEKMCLADTY